MTSHDSGERPLIDATLDEHRTCMQMVSELEACLDQQPDRAGEWTSRLKDKLAVLQETLRSHFETEEAGPMFSSVPINQPRFAARLEKLKVEHASILERVEGVVTRADRLDDDSHMYEIREVNAHTQLLVATIRRHEAEENEILIEAHWDEVGVGD